MEEAKFSSTFRLYNLDGLSVQFTVREENRPEFMDAFRGTVKQLLEMGWRVTEPVGNLKPRAVKIVGWILGNKSSGEDVLILYSQWGKFGTTVWPERIKEIPIDYTHAKSCGTTGTDRDIAIKQGFYNVLKAEEQFTIITEPDLDFEGNPKFTEKGKMKFRYAGLADGATVTADERDDDHDESPHQEAPRTPTTGAVAPSGATGTLVYPINNTGAPCLLCHAPNGMPHGLVDKKPCPIGLGTAPIKDTLPSDEADDSIFDEDPLWLYARAYQNADMTVGKDLDALIRRAREAHKASSDWLSMPTIDEGTGKIIKGGQYTYLAGQIDALCDKAGYGKNMHGPVFSLIFGFPVNQQNRPGKKASFLLDEILPTIRDKATGTDAPNGKFKQETVDALTEAASACIVLRDGTPELEF